MADTSKYEINYEDDRLTGIKEEETKALTDVSQTYDGMIAGADTMYDDLIAGTQQWADTQTQLQQERTDFTIEQIEQQKEKAEKDYIKEQAGAYVDWQKQSNQYGVNAEKIASAGMTNTGYSESSQVSMYNAYQNRVAVARESFNQAILNYDNSIKDARLQNNAALAEIAYQSFMQQAEYSVQATMYKNQLIGELADRKLQIQDLYNDKWKTQLDVMNKEIDRQFTADENEKERVWKEQHDKNMAEIEHKYDLERDKVNQDYKKELAAIEYDYNKKLLEAETAEAKKRADYQYELDVKKLEEEHQNDLERIAAQEESDKRLLQEEYRLEAASNQATITQNNNKTAAKNSSFSYIGSDSLIKGSTQDIIAGTSSVGEPKIGVPYMGGPYPGSSFGGSSSGGSSSGGSSSGKTTQATYNSINALGYGPISASVLAKKVASGEVIEYTKNGVTLFAKATPSLPTSKLPSASKSTVSLPTSKLR